MPKGLDRMLIMLLGDKTILNACLGLSAEILLPYSVV